MLKLLRRRFFTTFAMLGSVVLIRAYLKNHSFSTGWVVTHILIIIFSVTLGWGGTLLFLKQFNIASISSEDPFLATLMDVLSVLVYCVLIWIFLN